MEDLKLAWQDLLEACPVFSSRLLITLIPPSTSQENHLPSRWQPNTTPPKLQMGPTVKQLHCIWREEAWWWAALENCFRWFLKLPKFWLFCLVILRQKSGNRDSKSKPIWYAYEHPLLPVACVAPRPRRYLPHQYTKGMKLLIYLHHVWKRFRGITCWPDAELDVRWSAIPVFQWPSTYVVIFTGKIVSHSNQEEISLTLPSGSSP